MENLKNAVDNEKIDEIDYRILKHNLETQANNFKEKCSCYKK